ncbi:coatomer protein [Clavulina sp. PMI_390]|nr:coatomer protein [Clavulina sp. PMI_390]
MHLEVNKKLFARSDRVKSVDFHPTEPWVLAGLYNGTVQIYNHETGAVIKTFEVADVPVRCVHFVARKQWFVAGSDDFQLRAFNYNTHEKVAAFEAHPDYIRCLTVHPSLPLVLTGSDDMTIRAWDWEKGWKCVQVYEGHTHFIMALAINPKDANTFASACLDRTVKVWSFGSSHPNFTLDAHEKGVNYVSYYHGGEKPYMITSGDDRLVKVWDYHSKSAVQSLEGHTANASFAIFHPSLPVIISGSEDGLVKIWHANTYRLENTINYALERAWCVSSRKGSNDVALGFDDGLVVIKLGREEPTFSLDHAGKLVYIQGSEVLSVNLQTAQDEEVVDGQRLSPMSKELGAVEVYASTMIHSPNGRFVTVCGDGEYVIYTALAWRNKAFGNGTSFAWAGDSNTYAVVEGKTKIRVFKNFKEKTGAGWTGLKGAGSWAVSNVFGGVLLGAVGPGFVVFWDWESGEIVRRMEVDAKEVIWSSTGTLVAIIAEDSFYVLSFSRDAYNARLEKGEEITDEGVEEAFDVIAEISEKVKTAKWLGECFMYTTAGNRLNYLVGTQPQTVNTFETPMYLVGYMPTQNRVYVADKDMNLYTFSLSVSYIDYQSAALRGDMEAANEILPSIPTEMRNKLARFLDSQNLKEQALELTTDPDHKFELAISLNNIESALDIARSTPAPENEAKWKLVGDRALATWKFDLAKECFDNAGDVSSLFLLHLATGDKTALAQLALTAETKGLNNIALASLLQLGNPQACVDLLVKTDRIPEAAMFARTYTPSAVPKTVEIWKEDLKSKNRSKLAETIANPETNPEVFDEGWEAALEKEAAALNLHSDALTNGAA